MRRILRERPVPWRVLQYLASCDVFEIVAEAVRAHRLRRRDAARLVVQERNRQVRAARGGGGGMTYTVVLSGPKAAEQHARGRVIVPLERRERPGQGRSRSREGLETSVYQGIRAGRSVRTASSESRPRTATGCRW